MERSPNPAKGSRIGGLILGGTILGAAYYWPELTGAQPTPGGQFYSLIFGGIGAAGVAGSAISYWRAWLQEVKRQKAEKPSGEFGGARFAEFNECVSAGLTNPNGLYIGLKDGVPLFFNGKAHLLTVAPARQGKGVGFVYPALYHHRGSIIATDTKGELAAVTGRHRRERLGQKVVNWNPYALRGSGQHRINPLQYAIELAGDPQRQRGLSDEVKSIVLQLFPEPEDSKNRYFRDGARTILRAVIMYLALHRPDRCTLPEVWRIIANPKRLERVIKEMQRSEALGGLLADLGDDLAFQVEDNPDHFADFRSGAIQVIDIFEPGGDLAEAVSGNDVSLSELKSGNVTIYLSFPQDRIATHGAALGLIVNQAIKAVARSEDKGEVLFLLDEFANLGKLSGLAESLTALPGLGVRVWMFVQELAELVRLYGPQTTKTVLSQAEVKQFFAVGSPELAMALSRELGQKTVKTRSYSLGRFDDDEIGVSLGETGQPLMRPEEIMLMEPYEQLLLVNGMRPILGQRVPFWFIDPWGRWAEPNPIEGDYPQVEPLVRLEYSRKGESDE